MLVASASAEWKEQVLYSFQGGANDGAYPAGGVVFDKAGNLFGATTVWGPDNCFPIANECGLVFELSPPAKKGDPWTETILYQFKGKGANDASSPSGGVILDSAGNVYGVTAYGGTGDCVLLGTNAGCGVAYKLSPPAKKGDPWTETLLYSFKSGSDGYFPWGTLTFDAKGNLYGATQFGGGKGNSCNEFYGGNCGTVFELSPPKQKGGQWTEMVLYSYASGTDGANPNGGLVLDRKGAIYGTTYGGGNENGECGAAGCGTVFKLARTRGKNGLWNETILHRFKGLDGGEPAAGLVFHGANTLYGTTKGGGGGNYPSGTVFKVAHNPNRSWTEKVLYTFQHGDDGAFPLANVIFDARGNLFGVASEGGKNLAGTLFRMKPPTGRTSDWGFSILYSFNRGQDAGAPSASLVPDKAFNLYSTTPVGGTGICGNGGCGTVFTVSP